VRKATWLIPRNAPIGVTNGTTKDTATSGTNVQWKNPARHAANASTVIPTNSAMISGPPTNPASGSADAASDTAAACSAGSDRRIAMS
jgi:hypothetical protein